MRRVDPLRFHLAFCTPTPFCTSCWSKGGRRKPDASCKNRGHPIYACRSILELENDMKGLLSKTQTVTVLNQTAFHWQYLSRPGTCYATDHRRIYPHVNFVEDDKRLARSVSFPPASPHPPQHLSICSQYMFQISCIACSSENCGCYYATPLVSFHVRA